jgi:hypothetical protein
VLNVALVMTDGKLCTPRFENILAGLTVQRIMELAQVRPLAYHQLHRKAGSTGHCLLARSSSNSWNLSTCNDDEHVDKKGCGEVEKRARKPGFSSVGLLKQGTLGCMFDEDRNIDVRMRGPALQELVSSGALTGIEQRDIHVDEVRVMYQPLGGFVQQPGILHSYASYRLGRDR